MSTLQKDSDKSSQSFKDISLKISSKLNSLITKYNSFFDNKIAELIVATLQKAKKEENIHSRQLQSIGGRRVTSSNGSRTSSTVNNENEMTG